MLALRQGEGVFACRVALTSGTPDISIKQTMCCQYFTSKYNPACHIIYPFSPLLFSCPPLCTRWNGHSNKYCLFSTWMGFTIVKERVKRLFALTARQWKIFSNVKILVYTKIINQALCRDGARRQRLQQTQDPQYTRVAKSQSSAILSCRVPTYARLVSLHVETDTRFI